MNLSRTFAAWKDAYASNMGDWTIRDNETITLLGGPREVYAELDRFVSLGWQFRIIIRSQKTGKRHDIVVRRGVHNSKQDGPLSGEGCAMTDPVALNFGTWAHVHDGPAVCTGTGKGYRTWNAGEVLAIRATNDRGEKETALTLAGLDYISARSARHETAGV